MPKKEDGMNLIPGKIQTWAKIVYTNIGTRSVEVNATSSKNVGIVE